jgi:hypothetical protein
MRYKGYDNKRSDSLNYWLEQHWVKLVWHVEFYLEDPGFKSYYFTDLNDLKDYLLGTGYFSDMEIIHSVCPITLVPIHIVQVTIVDSNEVLSYSWKS